MEIDEEVREIGAVDHINKHMLESFKKSLEKNEIQVPENGAIPSETTDDEWNDDATPYNPEDYKPSKIIHFIWNHFVVHC